MIEKKVKELIIYAKSHLNLDSNDEVYFENILLGELNLTKPYDGKIDETLIEKLEVPDSIINPILDYVKEEFAFDDVKASRFITKLMGILTEKPSEVIKRFNSLESDKALDYLYYLSIYNNYIAKTAVDKNVLWEANLGDNVLEISINLSKPEKNNNDIKKLLTAKTGAKYPECLLCKENVGFYGNDSHPARENLRTIPITLADEKFFLQYSPYVYYDHHCIVFHDEHFNMKIDKKCFRELCDFVDLFPSFFIGSNSDLPIVGGSILNHQHFQGGNHLLPMLKAPVAYDFYTIGSVTVSKLNWYNSCILLKSSNKEELLNVADTILQTWLKYSDEENEIINYTTERHNTITPIVRKVENTYMMYLILRNNRCNEKYPDGIFHAHPEYHMIKKEGIGLIEAMGLFILPARLERQFKEIMDVYGMNDEDIISKYVDLEAFLPMIKSLKGNSLEDIRSYVNNVCMNILKNVAVFKDNEIGIKGFDKFMSEVKKNYE